MSFYGLHSRLLPKAGVFLIWCPSLLFIVWGNFTLHGAALHLIFRLECTIGNDSPDSLGHLVVIIHYADYLGHWFQNWLRVSIDLT